MENNKAQPLTEKSLDFKYKDLCLKDFEKIIHELHTHQIELQTQNEELLQTQIELEKSRKRYSDLYDFAPISYFIFDRKGIIRQLNLTATTKLKNTRDMLLGIPFSLFISKDCRSIFYEHIQSVIKTKEKQVCELKIIPIPLSQYKFDKNIDSKIDVQLQSVLQQNNIGSELMIRSVMIDITELKRKDREIREIENELLFKRQVEELKEFYENIVETIQEGLWKIDIKGKTLYVNKQMTNLLGYSESEMLGKNFFDFADENWKDFLYTRLERRKKGIKEKYECQFIKKDGTKIWVTVSASPIFDNNNIIGAIGLLTDITENKLAEEALRLSEEKFAGVFRRSPTAMALMSLNDYRIIDINEKWGKIFGFSRDEVIGTPATQLAIWKDRDKQAQAYDYMLKHDTFRDEDCELLKKNGEVWNAIVSFESISINGEPGILSSIVDVTERKLIEDKLRESEEKYRTIVEYSNDLIWVEDIEGSFTFCNKRAEKIVGFTLKELTGKHFEEFIIKEDVQKVKELFARVLQGQAVEYETSFTNKFGKTITISINKAPIFSKGRVIGATSFGRDITEQKKSEAKVKEFTAKLQKSNEELEQFAYVVSHDLQEPLRTISSYAALLSNRFKGRLNSEADDFISYIIYGTKRMQQMIYDLLDLSRISSRGKAFVPTDINEILTDVLQNLHELIDRNKAEIIIDKMPNINTDPSQITQLFQNLIDNAIKFRKPDIIPQINIRATYQDGDHAQWIFSVQDNGIGIDPKDFKKLFIIFHRLHSMEEYPGTGIGLAICKKIVERHGGKIWIESQLGKGSIFYFSIPIQDESS